MKTPLLPLIIITIIAAGIFGYVFNKYGGAIVAVNDTNTQTTSVTYYVVSTEPAKNATTFGCGDVLQAKQATVADTGGTVRQALTALFNDSADKYSETVINAVAASNLKIDSITSNNNVTTVALSGTVQLGGECDGPRFIEQIQKTANGTSTKAAVITLNGKPLSNIGSLK